MHSFSPPLPLLTDGAVKFNVQKLYPEYFKSSEWMNEKIPANILYFVNGHTYTQIHMLYIHKNESKWIQNDCSVRLEHLNAEIQLYRNSIVNNCNGTDSWESKEMKKNNTRRAEIITDIGIEWCVYLRENKPSGIILIGGYDLRIRVEGIPPNIVLLKD